MIGSNIIKKKPKKIKGIVISILSNLSLFTLGIVYRFENRINNLINPPAENNFALICYSYSIEISPFLKSFCSYMYDNGYGKTEIITNELKRSNLINQEGIRIIKFNSSISNILNKYLLIDSKTLYQYLLKLNLKVRKYNYIIAIEYQALDFLNQISFPLSKVSFLSLEGTDYMRLFPISDVLNNLPKCQSFFIASKERALEVNKFLKLNINFIYFPISIRPEIEMIKTSFATPKIIFSGYFAEWSALNELIDLYNNSSLSQPSDLYLQGHFYGTEEYLSSIKDKIQSNSAITIDTSYYSDYHHHKLLSKYDIGIAFYKNISGNDNFENLIFSSGKIASYLWAGLAVMTNINCELTKKLPFILVEDLKTENFINGLLKFKNNKEEFVKSAYKLAQTQYNFDEYMNEVLKKNIFPLAKINYLSKFKGKR